MNISELNKQGINDIIAYNGNQLESYIDRLTKHNIAKGDMVRANIKNSKDLENHRLSVRQSFMCAIGGLPETTDVKVEVTKTHEVEGLACQNIILETLPGFYATANVYKPEGAEGLLPAVLMVCGHSQYGRLYEAYQRVQRCIAKAGFIVLGLDPVGQGERITYIEEDQNEPAVNAGTYEHDYAGVQCLMTGITITRYFVHDGICALNYLAGREDVDENRIGVTGSSGGGTQTAMLMMAAPEKIAAAAIGTFITDREAILNSRQSQDLEQIWPGMASDGFDHADILACLAPKPLILLTVDSDFFPLEGTIRTITKTKPLWEMFDRGEALEIITDKSRHAYTWNLANAAADFFSRSLKGKTCVPLDNVSVSEHSDLYATKTGNVVVSLKSRIIHDYVKNELTQFDEFNKTTSYDKRRLSAKQFVRKQANNFNQYPLYIKHSYQKTSILNLNTELFTWYQQEGILNFGGLFKLPTVEPDKVIIAIWDGGFSRLHCHLDEIMDYCEQGYGVFILELVGTGSLANGYYYEHVPDCFYTKFTNFANDLLVNGDNIVAMRVRGICRAMDALEDIFARNVNYGIMTYGKFNLYGLMTKLIDDRVSFINECAPMESIRKFAERKYYNEHNIMSLVSPGMLRYFDIEDLRTFISE